MNNLRNFGKKQLYVSTRGFRFDICVFLSETLFGLVCLFHLNVYQVI